MKQNYLKIIFVIDESGSMQGSQSDVIGGFNNFIEEQKTNLYGKVDVTLYKFNNESTKVFSDLPLDSIRTLEKRDYTPGGLTALYDTIGIAINEAEKHTAHLEKDEKPNMVMMVIITDGQENASCEYSAHTVKQMIEKHERNEDWQFIYLGANLSSFSDADDLGIRHRASSSKENLKEKFGKVSEHTAYFREAKSLKANMSYFMDKFIDDLDDKKKKDEKGKDMETDQ